jgi:glycosyltransferase involved in cell wall biosynthesis
MHKPKVSVLMPVYNAEKYLRLAIESVLNQSFSDFELLIVDDGSTDGSREIIRSYGDQRIHATWNSTNRGECYTRNRALESARGKYVAVSDADDVALPGRFGQQVEFLDRAHDILVVGGFSELIDNEGKVNGVMRVPTDPLEIRWRLLFGNCMIHSTAMFRLEDARAVGGYGDFPFAQDFDLWRRLSLRGRFANIETPLSQYRVHNTSATQTTNAIVKEQTVFTIVARGIEQLTKNRVDSDVVRTMFRDINERATNEATLFAACRAIEDCLHCLFKPGTLTRLERKQLVSLALEDLDRIARKNPDFGKTTRSATLRCIISHDTIRLLQRQGMVLALESVLPGTMIHFLRKSKRIFAARA